MWFLKGSTVKGCLVMLSQSDTFYIYKCFVFVKAKGTEEIIWKEILLEVKTLINKIYKHAYYAVVTCLITLKFWVSTLIMFTITFNKFDNDKQDTFGSGESNSKELFKAFVATYIGVLCYIFLFIKWLKSLDMDSYEKPWWQQK